MSLGIASEHIELTQQREREAELIFVGQQYQKAIGSYYQRSPNGLKEFPTKLEDLIQDNRSISGQHHLRKRYVDPMTGSQEWGLVRNPSGQITGVYSLSPLRPITSREDLPFLQTENGESALITSYSDWKFVYIPKKEPAKQSPTTAQSSEDTL